MKKTIGLLLFTGAMLSSLSAAILQTVAGPNVATGGGVGNPLIDTTNDTGDWIDSFNAGGVTLYLGFDWTVDDNNLESGTGGFFGGLGIYNGTTERILVGNDWLGLNFAIARPGEEAPTTIPYVMGTSARLVAKITTVDGGVDNDTIELFVNQGTEGTADATFSGTIDDLTQLTHRAGADFGASTLSNLVVADDFASAAAVPEPSSAALLGLGGLALVLRRRK